MRLLYLYPEEWTGRRAREVHALSTCAALARLGVDVTLVTAGGAHELRLHLQDVAPTAPPDNLHLVSLSRRLGPIRSAFIFRHHFQRWLRGRPPFDLAYIIHLKAAAMLAKAQIPYAFEAHEIFAETPQRSDSRQVEIHNLELQVLTGAVWRIATSQALAAALDERYPVPGQFAIIPNAGLPPVEQSVGAVDGPFVYAGSIADWKGIELLIEACRIAPVPLKVIGGTAEEWKWIARRTDTAGIDWHPRVPLAQLPGLLRGASAGLVPTQPDTPSGRYSCPMKLFDYARCGLPVISTALPSLQTLNPGPWCREVPRPICDSWVEALRYFRFESEQAEEARAWSANHTWDNRAQLLQNAFGS